MYDTMQLSTSRAPSYAYETHTWMLSRYSSTLLRIFIAVKSCSTFVWSKVGGYILDAPVLPTSRAVAEEVITLFMTLAIEYFI